MKKISIFSICIVALVVLVTWASNASAMASFESEGAEGLSCAQCHPVFGAGPSDPDHVAHAEPAGNDCDSCHLGAFNDPPIGQNCTRCHGRLEDAGGDDISLGEGRGLRQHHQNAGASNCGACHNDATGPVGVGEDVPPAFYPGVGAVPLAPCDGSEEGFPSNTVSLDNDGDLLTDGADPNCAAPECTVDADCDNGVFCDGAETCDTATGTCQDGTPPSCDDNVACTGDSCDLDLDDCLNIPNDAFCDDNNVCNGSETCDPTLNCQPGETLDCDDGQDCTDDSCDLVTGCANVPVECPAGEQCDPADGVCKVPPECTVDDDCNNELFCDGVETCDTTTGTCQAGTPPNCDDGVNCTVDTCDEDTNACMHTTDDAICDDNTVCNGLETCDPDNDCQEGTPLDCNDLELCTTDSCDPVSGCANVPVECLEEGEQCDSEDGECKLPLIPCTEDVECDDGFFCNGVETCDMDTLFCQPGIEVDCDDGVDCSVDTCDETSDACMNTPDDNACPGDGLFCTGDEICDPEAAGCVSTGDPCPSGYTCNDGTNTCDMATGKVTICHIPPGKKAKAKSLTIGADGVVSHLAHGDLMGSCP